MFRAYQNPQEPSSGEPEFHCSVVGSCQNILACGENDINIFRPHCKWLKKEIIYVAERPTILHGGHNLSLCFGLSKVFGTLSKYFLKKEKYN